MIIDKDGLRGLFPQLSEMALSELHLKLTLLDDFKGVARGSYGDRVSKSLEFYLLIENIRAIRRFDASSRRLSNWLLGLTVVYTILTIVQFLRAL